MSKHIQPRAGVAVQGLCLRGRPSSLANPWHNEQVSSWRSDDAEVVHWHPIYLFRSFTESPICIIKQVT